MDPALRNEGERALKLGAIGKFDASALFLSHEVGQTMLGECLAQCQANVAPANTRPKSNALVLMRCSLTPCRARLCHQLMVVEVS
jgi:hypothetical protein